MMTTRDIFYDLQDDYYPETQLDAKTMAQDMGHAADFIVGVLDALYGDGPLDVAQLEDHLLQAAFALGVEYRCPLHLPNVERKLQITR